MTNRYCPNCKILLDAPTGNPLKYVCVRCNHTSIIILDAWVFSEEQLKEASDE